MDSDIQFGELEESLPERHLRPDQNRHYSVVSYNSPGAGDLPIFVDMDVMREMESHALSNTNVELGGVLLGGRYEDKDGNAFVLITDSLRAEHFEATKGSFKFTHETWSDITRKRDEFPEDMQMVGWYHTHPGWGVFLSGMDTFICDHFFNKPLDVALVIDPCQGERAFFQWTSQGSTRETRATGGFYLTASRFREPELEFFKAQLEGAIAMPSDPRYSGMPGAYPPPVVNIAQTPQNWLSVAVLGMLLMQFCVLALIAWRMLAPPDPATLAAAQLKEAQLKEERKFLDKIIGKLKVAPEGVVEELEEQRQENKDLELAHLGLRTHISEVEATNNKLEREKKRLTKDRKEALEVIAEWKDKGKAYQEEIEGLRNELKEYTGEEEEGESSTVWAWIKRWKWALSGAALLVLVAAAAAYAFYAPPEGEQMPVDDDVIEGPIDDPRDP